MKKAIVNVLVFFCGWPVCAFMDFGVGISSAHSGRLVPALAGAINGSSWLLSATSTGVQNDFYYSSSYTLSGFKTWQAGDLFWGPLRAGFGMGAFYSERAFSDLNSSSEQSSSDFGGGPAFYVKWGVLGPLYLNMEVIWGLRDVFTHFTLNGQDLVTFSLGISL